jgi:D-beta-D-heptose 7-phosphate kinase/D-beta-D-heptose 1-phosphate adenosyltransferase
MDLEKLKGSVGPAIAVYGDVMLDEHLSCEVLGISPEDDVALKIRVLSRTARPGGAANVAVNLAKLGADVSLAGVIGQDDAALELSKLLRAENIDFRCLQFDDRPTTVKTRYVTPRGRHLMRVDRERCAPLEDSEARELARRLLDAAFPACIVVSDYAKGAVQSAALGVLSVKAKVIVGPKRLDFMGYGEVEAIVPNRLELYRATRFPVHAPLEEVIKGIRRRSRLLVVTLAEDGCALLDGRELRRYPVRKREVVDPAGCGDSFLAGFAYALASGWTDEEACVVGNACGACAASHLGVHAVTRGEVIAELKAGAEGA